MGTLVGTLVGMSPSIFRCHVGGVFFVVVKIGVMFFLDLLQFQIFHFLRLEIQI